MTPCPVCGAALKPNGACPTQATEPKIITAAQRAEARRLAAQRVKGLPF